MTPDIPRPFFLLWSFFILALGAVPTLAVVQDFLGEIAPMMGRANNLASAWCALFLLLLPPFLKFADTPASKRFLLASAGFVLFALATTALQTTSPLLGYGSVGIIAGALAAGFIAHVLAREGHPAGRVLVAAVLLSAIGLPLIPLLISIDPDRHEKFWMHVYGHGNIRSVGFYAAAGIAVATGLGFTPGTGRARAIRLALLFVLLVATWTVLFWSGSRAAVAALALSLPFSLILLRRLSWVALPTTLAAIPLGAWLSTFLWAPDRTFGLANRVEATLGALRHADSAQLAATRVTSNRTDLWLWGLDRIREAHLWGEGALPMFRYRTPQFNYLHLHNIALEYLWDYGIPVGGAVLALAFLLWARALGAARRQRGGIAGALGMMLATLAFYAQVDAILLMPFHLLFFTMAIGVLLARTGRADGSLPQDSPELSR